MLSKKQTSNDWVDSIPQIQGDSVVLWRFQFTYSFCESDIDHYQEIGLVEAIDETNLITPNYGIATKVGTSNEGISP